jgi:pimeloyl-ACP methyl ester carboxylesterase
MSSQLFTKTLGQGKELGMLHSWVLYSGIWQSVTAQLATYFHITLIDLSGFGKRCGITGTHHELNTVVQQLLTTAPEWPIWLGWSLSRYPLPYCNKL